MAKIIGDGVGLFSPRRRAEAGLEGRGENFTSGCGMENVPRGRDR